MNGRRGSGERERMIHLIRTDAANVVARLEERSGEMISLFSRHRDRHALLGPLRTWMDGASVSDLRALEPAELTAVSAFYERLDALHWYFKYTEDMPGTAEQVLTAHRRKLSEARDSLERTLAAPAPKPKAAKRRTGATPRRGEPARPARSRR